MQSAWAPSDKPGLGRHASGRMNVPVTAGLDVDPHVGPHVGPPVIRAWIPLSPGRVQSDDAGICCKMLQRPAKAAALASGVLWDGLGGGARALVTRSLWETAGSSPNGHAKMALRQARWPSRLSSETIESFVRPAPDAERQCTGCVRLLSNASVSASPFEGRQGHPTHTNFIFPSTPRITIETSLAVYAASYVPVCLSDC